MLSMSTIFESITVHHAISVTSQKDLSTFQLALYLGEIFLATYFLSSLLLVGLMYLVGLLFEVWKDQ